MNANELLEFLKDYGVRKVRLGTEVLAALERGPSGSQVETQGGVTSVRPDLLGAKFA
jgi:hypothetical protein